MRAATVSTLTPLVAVVALAAAAPLSPAHARPRAKDGRAAAASGAARASSSSSSSSSSSRSASRPASRAPSRSRAGSKPWCAPEVAELSDHVCYFEGAPATDGHRTLVVYLHGLLATTPGFQWLQQRAMAIHAKRQHFTVLLPTSPMARGSYLWPTGRAAQAAHEADVIAGIHEARAKLEQTLGVHFDETFVVGFSSGAYYASSLALRGALDVDGYLILAGGSSWAGTRQAEPATRVPVYVGVSAADRHSAGDSRALAGTLAALRWPYRVEERNAGHMVDWGFMDHGLAWLRAKARARREVTTN
jgi:predicted esterase